MRDFRKQILCLAVLCGGCASLQRGPSSNTTAYSSSYTVTDLGTLPGASSTKVADINKNGEIVGTSGDHAFQWSNGVMTDLGTVGGKTSAAYRINDQGVVVGEASTASGEMHAFVWQNGIMKDLGVAGETSAAHGINSRGEIVGVASAKNVRGGAVLWSSGQRHFLGDLGPSGSGSTGISINDNGQIAGVSSGFASNQGVVRGVYWQNGTIIDLDTLGGLHSTANAVNDQGVVVGWSEIADSSTVAFQWQNGMMKQLGLLPGASVGPGTGGQAEAVNDSGQVVGTSPTSSGNMHAVIWNNGEITDLNSAISNTSGIVLARAMGINNSGQIVVEQQVVTDGTTRAFLLTRKSY